MRRYLITTLLLLFACGTMSARIGEVVIDINGNFHIVVQVDDHTYAEVSEYGELLDIYENGPGMSRHNRRPGSFGRIDIRYHSDFWDYKAGKVKTIGSIDFEYDGGVGSDRGLLESVDGNRCNIPMSWRDSRLSRSPSRRRESNNRMMRITTDSGVGVTVVDKLH